MYALSYIAVGWEVPSEPESPTVSCPNGGCGSASPVLKLPRDPDTARADSTIGTIGIVGLLVQSDSAYVDLTFVPSARTMHGKWMFTAYRYRYRREQGRWSFVRPEWLGSA